MPQRAWLSLLTDKGSTVSQSRSDPVSALSPMRSPQCYVSFTEKYSYTLRKMLFCKWRPCYTDVAQTRVIYTEHACRTAGTHVHTHKCTHTCMTGEKEPLCVLLGFFFFFCVNGILTTAERCLHLFTRKLGHTLSAFMLLTQSEHQMQSSSSGWWHEVPSVSSWCYMTL